MMIILQCCCWRRDIASRLSGPSEREEKQNRVIKAIGPPMNQAAYDRALRYDNSIEYFYLFINLRKYVRASLMVRQYNFVNKVRLP